MTILRTSEAWGRFRLTAEVITAEGYEAGDAAERGWLTSQGDLADEYWESSWDLRDLADLFGRGYRPEGDGSTLPRWLTFDASNDDLISPCEGWRFLADEYGPEGDEEVIGGSISVHRPGWITDGSWARVCRLLGWRPYRWA